MLTHEHVQTAQEFLEKAEAEFEAGDILQGSEKLWGAATHAIMANAQLRGWNFGSHKAMGEAVDRLAEEYADESLESGFAAAEKCHANYYHDFMEDYELVRARAIVPRFVNRLLALLPSDNGV
ncbi:MAG: PaREP1/PaREP8 domain-containing protein [Chloroflexota bacterium]|nr:PaREP1/PaREP8 domain-containing protein [Chloroflexota bacterium]